MVNRRKIVMCLLTIFMFGICSNVYAYSYNPVNCGSIKNIPLKLPELVSWIITLAQIIVPVILIIVSMVDLVKAMSAQKEEEIKKGQQMLIKRIIVAVLIFFIVAGVKLVTSLVANDKESDSIIKCIDCFMSGTKKKCK